VLNKTDSNNHSFIAEVNPEHATFVLLEGMDRSEAGLFVLQEGSTLRSALSVTLSATGCPWPAFVPMHDPLRDAYWGVAATCPSGFAFLETDSVHISQLPPHLLKVAHLPMLVSFHLHP